MPVRITCPSCSATLSVKDEYAGRAVKCPKCGGTIPASQPAAPPPAPPPAPPAPPAQEPERSPFEALDEPVPARAGSKPARPKADDDEADRPATRGGADTDNEDAPRRRKGAQAADEDRDDRPMRRKRREADDDRPARGKKAEGGSNVALILGIVGVALLTCCGGGVFGVYYFMVKVRDAAKEKLEQVSNDLKNMEAASGPAVEVSAADLAKEYKDNPGAADTKYKDKLVLVEGKLEAIDVQADGTVTARLIGVGVAGANGLQVRCVVSSADVNKVWNTSRGQTIKFRGKCAGQVVIFVDVLACKYEGNGPDPSINVTAAGLIAEVGKSSEAADEKYKEKPVTITGAVVESKKGESLVLIGAGKAKSAVKIKATWPFDYKQQIANLKPGDKITIKGEYGGSFDGSITINGAWLVP